MLKANVGENIYSFSKRLINHSKDLNARVTGEFNEINLVADKDDSPSAVEWQYQFKALAIRTGRLQDYM